MDAFSLMKKDHRKVEKLFKKIMATTEKTLQEREILFQEIKNELDAHAYMEEKVFYPFLKNKSITRDITLEAYEEHHIVKLILMELDEMEKKQDEWMAKLAALKENVEHHVGEEENEMFSKAQKIIDKNEAKTLGKSMEEAKKEFTM